MKTAKLFGLLERVGLRTPEQRAWAMYDWANSAMVVVVIAAVFPIFFASYAASGLPAEVATLRFSIATTIGLAIIALVSPVLGAIADQSASKLRMLRIFLIVGVVAIAMMFFIRQGQWFLAAVLFILANIGANGSFVFYDSLLPHVATPDEVDQVSTAGYALGYVGGGSFLLLCLFGIQRFGSLSSPSEANPTDASLPVRLTFLATAVWWVLFSIPLFRRVSEPKVRILNAEERRRGTLSAAFARLRMRLLDLRRYRHAFLLLVAFLIYNDGIGTIIRMATIYGEELELDRTVMITAIVIVQFVGIPFAVLFGALAGLIGPKHSIFVGLASYVGITFLGYYMTTSTHFFVLATLVGMVQGGTQALSRSLFGSMIPRQDSGEFFGLFAVFEKFAGMAGPAVFALMIAATGSSRAALLSLISFFAVGALLLLFVDVDEGRRVAREAEEAAVSPEAHLRTID